MGLNGNVRHLGFAVFVQPVWIALFAGVLHRYTHEQWIPFAYPLFRAYSLLYQAFYLCTRCLLPHVFGRVRNAYRRAFWERSDDELQRLPCILCPPPISFFPYDYLPFIWSSFQEEPSTRTCSFLQYFLHDVRISQCYLSTLYTALLYKLSLAFLEKWYWLCTMFLRRSSYREEEERLYFPCFRWDGECVFFYGWLPLYGLHVLVFVSHQAGTAGCCFSLWRCWVGCLC